MNNGDLRARAFDWILPGARQETTEQDPQCRAMLEDANRTRLDRRWDAVAYMALLMLCSIVFMKDISVAGFRWGDASVHAMDGVLIYDWVAAGPEVWLSPIDFAVRQYAHFPSLGIGRTYPPGFAVFEALFFAVMGISIWTARFCVVCFAALGIIGAYRLGRYALPPLGAFAAATGVLGIPAVVYWTRQVMLEMPTLTVLIWGAIALVAYRERPNWRRWALLVALLIAAPLFKQTSVFFVGVAGILLTHDWRRGAIPTRHYLAGLLTTVMILSLFFWFTFRHGAATTHVYHLIGNGTPTSEWLTNDSLTFYWRYLPERVGWPVVLLAGLGLCLSLRHLRGVWLIVLLWFVLFVIMSTLIQLKLTRYFFFAYLPMGLWVGLAVYWLWSRFTSSWVQRSAVTVSMLLLVVAAYQTPIDYRPNYEPLVEKYADRIEGNVVFFEGRRDGDFVFAVREHLGPHSAVVIRGSKLLYSCAAAPEWNFTSYVSGAKDIHRAMTSLGISLAIVERENVDDIAEVDMLHDYLQTTPVYSKIATYNMGYEQCVLTERLKPVDVYLPTGEPKRTLERLTINLHRAARIIDVEFDELLPPRTAASTIAIHDQHSASQ